MKKLEKRQIIILVVAALCALYAAYEFLIAQPAAKKNKEQAAAPVAQNFDMNAFTSDLSSYKVSSVDLYIEKQAEMSWGKSPFWEKTAYQEFVGKDAAGADSVVAKVIYSGYIDTGRKKIAILNGAEYAAGESLELEGYMLKSVKSANVIIVNRKTGAEIEVPIQE